MNKICANLYIFTSSREVIYILISEVIIFLFVFDKYNIVNNKNNGRHSIFPKSCFLSSLKNIK
jgi:hypothetical protein